MSASTTRRRTSLLTGGSMLAAIVLAGAGGASLAPATALAANECGDPGTNGAAADVFTCAGAFAAITYPTTNGALTLNLQNNVSTTTGGLVVTVAPTATTNVTINRIADSPANSGDPSLVSTTGAGLQVTRATGASISVNLTDNDTTDAPLVISGTTAGVLLQNAAAPSGILNTSFTSSNGTISASAGAGIDVSTTGSGNLDVNSGSAVTGSTYAVRATSTGNIITINNTGSGTMTGASGAILVVTGARADVSNAAAATINGRVTLNNTGQSAFSNAGLWTFSGDNALNTGVTVLTNTATGVISTGAAASIDFRAGFDSFDNAGTLAIGAGGAGAATLTLTSLENWDNSGVILFGANGGLTDSDGATNDRLVASGVLYTGAAGSTLVMDADLTADQADCSAAVAADCLDLHDATTAGTTIIQVNNVAGGLEPGHKLTLVDVSGVGSSTVAAFQLDPSTPGYRRVGDAETVESGPYFYGLIYDPTAQHHVLVTGFSDSAFAVSRIGRAVTEPWRTVATTSQNRQADLRQAGEQGGGLSPGVWLKAAGNATSEESIDLGAQQVLYDGAFDQRTVALTGGVDLLRFAGDDTLWLAGITAGKLDSSLEYTALDAELELDGYSFGAYASFMAGPFYVDGVLLATNLDFTHTNAGGGHDGSASAFGFQAEAGYRLLQFDEDGAYLEPLVVVSHVTAEIDDVTSGSTVASFDEAVSTRAALGLRVGGNAEMGGLTARLSFTGRVWEEFEGENTTAFSSPLGDGVLVDARQDTLGDVSVGIGLLSAGGRLSADLGYGLTFREGYTSNEASVSLRFNW